MNWYSSFLLLTDEPGPFLRDNAQHPLLMDHHSTSISEQLGSRQHMSSHNPSTEHLSGTVFDCLGLESRPGPIRAPSPRIEITPSGDSHSSATLEPVPGAKALGPYRECVSPASSNSSTGWPVDAYSPAPSPTPTAGFAMGLSGLDLCPALQGIRTSSTHSSPGTSQRNSITEDSFLRPQYPRSISSVPHQRSRSAPPHGKRSHDQAHSCQGGTPVKQRSRSPSPSPIPWPHEQQGSYYLHQYQTQTSSSGPEMLASISPGLQRPPQTSTARDSHWQAKREDYAYLEGFEWTAEQEKMDRLKTEVMPETFYVLPTVWSPLHHGGVRCVVCPFSNFYHWSSFRWFSNKLSSLSVFLSVGCLWLHFHLWSGRYPVSLASISFSSSSNLDLTTELIMRLKAAEEPWRHLMEGIQRFRYLLFFISDVVLSLDHIIKALFFFFFAIISFAGTKA